MLNKTETLLSSSNECETVKIMNFLNELEPNEKKDLLMFVQGARYVKGLLREVEVS